MAAAAPLAYLGIVLWTLASLVAAVLIGRAVRRLDPIPVRTTPTRFVDLRRPR